MIFTGITPVLSEANAALLEDGVFLEAVAYARLVRFHEPEPGPASSPTPDAAGAGAPAQAPPTGRGAPANNPEREPK